MMLVTILFHFSIAPLYLMGRDSSVGTATRYELDGPGIESRWGGKIFSTRPERPWAYPAPCTMGTGSFPGVKQLGRGVNHPPPSSAKVKERVELYLYSPSGWAFMACSRVNFTFLPLPLYLETLTLSNLAENLLHFV
jgi:hypothetical protein